MRQRSVTSLASICQAGRPSNSVSPTKTSMSMRVPSLRLWCQTVGASAGEREARSSEHMAMALSASSRCSGAQSMRMSMPGSSCAS